MVENTGVGSGMKLFQMIPRLAIILNTGLSSVRSQI